jgi:hypothetical protein
MTSEFLEHIFPSKLAMQSELIDQLFESQWRFQEISRVYDVIKQGPGLYEAEAPAIMVPLQSQMKLDSIEEREVQPHSESISYDRDEQDEQSPH